MSTLISAKPSKAETGQVGRPVGMSGAITEMPSARVSDDLVVLRAPQGMRAEAIRALRTHVVAQHVNGGRRALALCAASEGVGCTFVAANLAAALSQIGIKTLLIDGDLRHPAIESFFPPIRPVSGLQQCLASAEVSFAECIEAEVLPNLSIMYAGGAASNPQELLAGDRFRDLMDVCLRDYDVTIIDTPPSSRCADARRIGNVVGYGLIVARQNHSLIDDVKTLIKELQEDHAKVIGTVLNEA
jgi:protein-tyrosine kinase